MLKEAVCPFLVLKSVGRKSLSLPLATSTSVRNFPLKDSNIEPRQFEEPHAFDNSENTQTQTTRTRKLWGICRNTGRRNARTNVRSPRHIKAHARARTRLRWRLRPTTCLQGRTEPDIPSTQRYRKLDHIKLDLRSQKGSYRIDNYPERVVNRLSGKDSNCYELLELQHTGLNNEPSSLLCSSKPYIKCTLDP
ncbi:hypothetical protein XELAEV_18038621mg [Xenopus laevis]|uniref:Uncharacterized protein n=1 Tax=Xenopus laevis TaxID=8355 RepID=A0A974C772_XENLA|nr:hypothetical protein XELAEV_18038621mg [Xenopus laevis]